ncbi:hypothetical protein EWB00_011044 [Schistosoma japonicum]|uniref:Uncharacterized protein n=1 Tax=Schistosoma japonicum TaxID=6182 RepID=A0A4Z2DM72_SCHJA|nr:hypothetical protein EWB00_011044 [Schistosoma japonicum]
MSENFNPSQRGRSRFFGIIDDISDPNLKGDNDNEGIFTNNSTTSGYNNRFINTTSTTTSMNDNDDEMVFQFDEMFGQTTFHDIGQCCNSSISDSPPLGRPRRENPKPLTGLYQVEFPGIFVEGFHGGHVKFNIPGVLRGSLNPTDSMILKINLLSPDEHSHLSEAVHEQPSFSRLTQIEDIAQNKEASGMISGRFTASCLEQNTHQMSGHCTTMDCTSDVFSNSCYNQPNPAGNPCQLNSVETNKSDAHLLRCGTECSTISSIPYSSSRFPSIYERISTDSGLPSNCLVRSVISGYRKIEEGQTEEYDDRGCGGGGDGEQNSVNIQLSRFGQFSMK